MATCTIDDATLQALIKRADELRRENERLLKALRDTTPDTVRIPESAPQDACPCQRPRAGCVYHDPRLQP